MSKWPMVRLGEVAKPISRPVPVQAGSLYRTIGVKWWGEGAYERQTIDGSQTSAKILSLIYQNDLIINKIWVRHGSTAIADRSVDGCAASNEFPTFELDQNHVFIGWMHWLTKTRWFWDRCDELSKGTSGKNRIKPNAFLNIKIPLPPLIVQTQIVDHINNLHLRFSALNTLIDETDKGLITLCQLILHDSSTGEPVPTPMSELVTLREPNISVSSHEVYHFAGVYCFGRGVFVGQKKSGMEFAYPRLTRLREGDFVYPKLMAWEGALAVVPPECDGLVVSTEFPVFAINRDRVHPEVLDVYFRDPAIWPALSGVSTGTNVRRRRLNPADFLRHKMPLPNRQTQEKLKMVKSRADRIIAKHRESSTELAAMMPSILDLAFRGEL